MIAGLCIAFQHTGAFWAICCWRGRTKHGALMPFATAMAQLESEVAVAVWAAGRKFPHAANLISSQSSQMLAGWCGIACVGHRMATCTCRGRRERSPAHVEEAVYKKW